MSKDLKQAQQELQLWRDTAVEAGWLPADLNDGIDTALAEDPTQLFSGVEQRPLVVAFFGGTGVGKSSLLNRLAGAEVARTGVLRPTSREVTVYAHESLSLTQLPAQIPADKVQVSSHRDQASRQVVWIDTPDVDSVATEHREQVLAWLPYVDLVVYVVSPERYKDDAGWQMLREAGDQHAWMFALNQWDRGQPEQLVDFKRVLAEAGFSDPQVFCTICSEPAQDDDFDALREAVSQLAEASNLSALMAQAQAAQAQKLQQGVTVLAGALGSDASLDEVDAEFEKQFAERAQKIEQDLAWQMAASAQRFEEEQGGWRQLLTGKRSAPSPADTDKAIEVWDARAEQQVRDALSVLTVSVAERQLPVAPLKPQLSAVADKAAELARARQRSQVSEALAKPGTFLHRWLFKFVALVAALAPIAALAWIGYRVVISFYFGNTEQGEYLGADFAINSVLLLGVAWLLPALLREKLRPSLRASVERALKAGLQEGLQDVSAEAKKCLSTFNTDRQAQRDAVRLIVSSLPQVATSDLGGLSSLRPTE
ncbi:MAG: GTPase [Granulosicoccaceae bacterium]